MKSSERLLATVNHQQVDKVPAHINATKWVVSKLKSA